MKSPGPGPRHATTRLCPKCHGAGELVDRKKLENGEVRDEPHQCPRCEGEGSIARRSLLSKCRPGKPCPKSTTVRLEYYDFRSLGRGRGRGYHLHIYSRDGDEDWIDVQYCPCCGTKLELP